VALTTLGGEENVASLHAGVVLTATVPPTVFIVLLLFTKTAFQLLVPLLSFP